MGKFRGSLGGKWNRADAAEHLIFNVHNLFDSNLAKYRDYLIKCHSQIRALLIY